MKIEINKCGNCGRLFEDEKLFNLHIAKERKIEELHKEFPKVEDKTCDFANGHYSIQRDEKWLVGYSSALYSILKQFNETSYPFMSYGFFRQLDDEKSVFYGVACRTLHICSKCHKEWGQQYYANNCCGDKE